MLQTVICWGYSTRLWIWRTKAHVVLGDMVTAQSCWPSADTPSAHEASVFQRLCLYDKRTAVLMINIIGSYSTVADASLALGSSADGTLTCSAQLEAPAWSPFRSVPQHHACPAKAWSLQSLLAWLRLPFSGQPSPALSFVPLSLPAFSSSIYTCSSTYTQLDAKFDPEIPFQPPNGRSNSHRILLRYDRKSRYRRIKKQHRYERLAATSQLSSGDFSGTSSLKFREGWCFFLPWKLQLTMSFSRTQLRVHNLEQQYLGCSSWGEPGLILEPKRLVEEGIPNLGFNSHQSDFNSKFGMPRSTRHFPSPTTTPSWSVHAITPSTLVCIFLNLPQSAQEASSQTMVPALSLPRGTRELVVSTRNLCIPVVQSHSIELSL